MKFVFNALVIVLFAVGFIAALVFDFAYMRTAAVAVLGWLALWVLLAWLMGVVFKKGIRS